MPLSLFFFLTISQTRNHQILSCYWFWQYTLCCKYRENDNFIIFQDPLPRLFLSDFSWISLVLEKKKENVHHLPIFFFSPPLFFCFFTLFDELIYRSCPWKSENCPSQFPRPQIFTRPVLSDQQSKEIFSLQEYRTQ